MNQLNLGRGDADARSTTVHLEKHWVPVYLVRGDAGEATESYHDIRPGVALPDPLPPRPDGET